MTIVEQGLVAGGVVVLAGLVGYKVVKKKKPELIARAKRSVSDAKGRVCEIIEKAKQSFMEGYAKA